MLPASLHRPCSPCALHCALQQAAALLGESSDHFGFACAFFAGATATTAAYVSAMPTQTATPLPRRHALSAPVFTMHTARATLRGHPRRTPGLSCTLPGVTLAIATLPACERSRRHSFPMTNSPPRLGRRVLCVLPTACLPSGSSLVHRALCTVHLASHLFAACVCRAQQWPQRFSTRRTP